MTHTLKACFGSFSSCLILASLSACASRLHELPPPNVNIAGVWELNPTLSSDADKVLASLQPKPRPRKGSAKGPGGGSGSAGPPAPEVINDPTTDLPPIDTTPGARNADYGYADSRENPRNQYRPPIDFQINALQGGQWLKIRQTDTEVNIVNAASSRNFTPGGSSVVSVPSGVADQEAGWSGRGFQIVLKPQIGPKVDETYTLSGDGRQLLVKIAVGSEGRNKPIKVTRTYDRSTRDPASLRPTMELPLPPTD